MKFWRKPFDQTERATILAHVLIDKDRCKGCGFCVEFCSRKVLKLSTELGPKGYKSAIVDDENKCLNCGFCEAICPEFAVKLSPVAQAQEAKEVSVKQAND